MISAIVLSIVLHAQTVIPWIGSARGSGGASPVVSVLPVVITADIVLIPADQIEVLP